MLAVERHRRILELLARADSVKVSGLSEQLQVTEKTIREDLEKLEEKGLLRRIHGGAVPLAQGAGSLLPLRIPDVRHLAQKQAIARRALELIDEGDIIALDAGSTTLELARLLKNRPLTVLTNDLLIVRELTLKDQIRLVVPGGYSQHNLLIGTEEQLEWVSRLNVHKLFLSATGIHAEYGLTIFTEELTRLKKLFMAAARETYCLADHSKFDRGALLTFAALTDVKAIITDAGAGQELVDKYTALGCTLIRA